jgi:hypothetical protein
MQLLNTALLNTAALLNAAPMKKVVRSGACCVLALALPGIILAQDRAQPSQPVVPPSQAVTSTAPPQNEAALSILPDSPGAAWAKENENEQASSRQQEYSSQARTSTTTQTGTPQPGSSPSESVLSESSQSGTSQDTAAKDQSQKPQRPVGTAAAEAPKANGITAAQPAGVAIAPAKQHRVRTIVLRVGAIVGAGVAVGTVFALTEGTASKPPGAH